jgi:hypothetical protein
MYSSRNASRGAALIDKGHKGQVSDRTHFKLFLPALLMIRSEERAPRSRGPAALYHYLWVPVRWKIRADVPKEETGK